MGRNPVTLTYVIALGVVFSLLCGVVATPYLDMDEAFSILLSHQPAGAITAVCRGDNHPPLYYLLLHWLPASSGTLAVYRSVSLLAMFLLCIPLGRLAQICSRGSLAQAGILLIPLSPFFLFFSLYMRMYALLALAEVIILYAYWHSPMDVQWRAVFTVAALAAVSLHYLGTLFVVLLLLHALLFKRWRWKLFVLPLLLSVFWGIYLGGGIAETVLSGNRQLAWLPALTGDNLGLTLWRVLGIIGLDLSKHGAYPFVPLAVYLLFLVREEVPSQRVLLSLIWLGPAAALVAVSLYTGTNHLVARALFPAQLFFILILISALRVRRGRFELGVLLLCLVLAVVAGYGSWLYLLRFQEEQVPRFSGGVTEVHSSTISYYPSVVLYGIDRRLLLDGAGIVHPRVLAAAVSDLTDTLPARGILVNLPEAPGAAATDGWELVSAPFIWDMPVEVWRR